MEKIGNITLYNADCMEIMRSFKDKEFDLAIVDPPYGINNAFQTTSRIAKYGQVKTVNDWKPDAIYFSELFRISKNQIIWGYNHLSDMLPSCKEFLFWYKHQPVVSYSDGELAWTSFNKTAKCIDLPYFGTMNADEQRIHPTQKPVKLYAWLLNHYAKPGMKILDTHGGAMSSMIACYRGGMKQHVLKLTQY
ncbi:MAG: site-specific DNA-methyltransferase, partial [Bacteroidales bacterium]|nr:site-specific DNA-methyltransferase [Bacteroidales bacterium]